jgi:hypothetical protein
MAADGYDGRPSGMAREAGSEWLSPRAAGLWRNDLEI